MFISVLFTSCVLTVYWVNVDPFDNRGQFCDKGFSYRSALFPATDEEYSLAVESKSRVEKRLNQGRSHLPNAHQSITQFLRSP